MKLSNILPLISLAAAVYIPGDNYSTFTPSAGLLAGATTDFTTTFGLAINAITSSVKLTSVSATTTAEQNDGALVTQIGDGQIQATTSTAPKTINNVITQIGDGQVQAATSTTLYYSPSTTSTSTSTTEINVVTQIGDGQIQADYSTTLSTSYITSDDSTTTVVVTPTETLVETITSATLQTLAAETVTVDKRAEPTLAFEKRDLDYGCASTDALSLTLEDTILRDAEGRIGSIVSNQQFQFDGPTPQADAIYTAGWSIVDGKLALGDSTTFYQCLSGDFYNIYDEHVAEQCTAVELDIVILVTC